MDNIIFMIEGGKALELVKQHIAERRRVLAQNKAIADELGVKEVRVDRETGELRAVVFPGKIPEGWTKPDKHGCCLPKKGAEWWQRFRQQKGHPDPSVTIAEAFKIPMSIEYSSGGGTGFRHIGSFLHECGFLYMSPDGPYAMWVPDVPGEVAADEARGHTVAEPAKSFKLEFEGCRRIESEEWDLLVAQHKLAKKRAAAEAAA